MGLGCFVLWYFFVFSCFVLQNTCIIVQFVPQYWSHLENTIFVICMKNNTVTLHINLMHVQNVHKN